MAEERIERETNKWSKKRKKTRKNIWEKKEEREERRRVVEILAEQVDYVNFWSSYLDKKRF